MQPPTGYSMKAETWVNSSALLGRMNFALALAAGKLKGVQVDQGRLLNSGIQTSDSQQVLARLENSLLAGDVSRQTHDTISKQLEEAAAKRVPAQTPANVGAIEGLILGSPEFQRR